MQNNIVIVWCINNEKQTRFSIYKTDIGLPCFRRYLRYHRNAVFEDDHIGNEYSWSKYVADFLVARRRIVIGRCLQRL